MPAERTTRRSAAGPHESVLEDLVLTGLSLHSGLNAPPTASQSFVPGEAMGTELLRPNGPSCSENLLPKAIPLNYQMDFRCTSGNRRGLFPVRFGQRVQLPAGGSNDSSCGSKGAWVKSKWTSFSIHEQSCRTVTASVFRSLKADAVER